MTQPSLPPINLWSKNVNVHVSQENSEDYLVLSLSFSPGEWTDTCCKDSSFEDASANKTSYDPSPQVTNDVHLEVRLRQ